MAKRVTGHDLDATCLAQALKVDLQSVFCRNTQVALGIDDYPRDRIVTESGAPINSQSFKEKSFATTSDAFLLCNGRNSAEWSFKDNASNFLCFSCYMSTGLYVCALACLFDCLFYILCCLFVCLSVGFAYLVFVV